MKIAVVLRKILPPLWLGMAVSIAIEAQLKFQAPGITRELGLGIGKVVFTATNRIEWGLLLALGIVLFVAVASKIERVIYLIIVAVLLIQTFWLMPALIARIDAIVGGFQPPESSLHLFYIAAESLKILFLLALAIFANRLQKPGQ